MATYKIKVEDPDGNIAEFECADDEYVLDAMEEAGFEHNSSCRAGGCNACEMKLTSGEVDQDEQAVLDDDEVEAGAVLSCVAYPQSDCTFLGEQGS